MKQLLTPKKAGFYDCCGPQAAHPIHSRVCSGASCMAWIWWDESKSDEPLHDWSNRRGYCGLARE